MVVVIYDKCKLISQKRHSHFCQIYPLGYDSYIKDSFGENKDTFASQKVCI